MKNPVDEWVAMALTDDQMVIELLLRLKHAGTAESENPTANLRLLRWGSRQRRSRPSRFSVGVGGCMKKETNSARASPMTPLCWSGGSGSDGSISPSAATVDGFEDTSRQASCSTSTGSGSGSKALHAINEINSFCSKKSKKKKTFLEIKDVDKLHFKQSTKINQRLKKIKLEYSDRVKHDLISKSNLEESNLQDRNEKHVSECYRERIETKSSEEKGFFFLPDLNMTPTDED